ncbi:MAG: hypothetical protein R3C39_07650 [Dehalococcoidia bacterium]
MGIWVGRYSMVGGDVQEHGPGVVDRRRVQDDESVRLVVLAEPVDERSAEFASEVAEAVAALFRRESLSLTGGLLRALRQAHTNLAEWNRRSLREHRVAVGLTCVAIREGEATVAQVGPGTVFARAGGEVRRFVTDGEPAENPLGGTESIEPSFARVRLADEPLLLLTSNVEREIGVEAIAAALAQGPERALADLFLRTRGVRDMAAVFIADLDLAEEEGGDTGGGTVITEGPSSTPAPTLDSEVDDAPRVPEIDSAPPPVPRPVGGRARSLPGLRRSRMVGRSGTRRELPLRAIGIVAAVILVALVAWFALPPLLREGADTRLDDAIATADQQLGDATTASNAGELVDARAALAEASTEVEAARAIDGADPRIADLDARVAALTAALDRVIEVSALRAVVEFEGAVTAPFTPQEIAFGGGGLWLLDADGGRVFSIDASSGSLGIVYRAGQDYGGTTSAAPAAIAWDQDGRRLLVLDADRNLFALSEATTPFALPLRGADELRSPGAIAAYNGNLYILDVGAREVWRYAPAGDGFDSERSGLLGGLELPDAHGLAIDGDVFVLSDDALRHFRLGEELTPLLTGVDRPPSPAAAVVEDVLRGRFYVADRGGERILVSDREGAFISQFHHPAFFDLRGLAVADDGSVLYVLTADGIFAFDPLVEFTPTLTVP